LTSKPATVCGWDSNQEGHQKISFALNHNHSVKAKGHTHTCTINKKGEDGTNKNLPPYVAVYMWKRIS
jgi:hypothetical protein